MLDKIQIQQKDKLFIENFKKSYCEILLYDEKFFYNELKLSFNIID